MLHHAPQLAAPPRRVRTLLIVSLMYEAMNRCIAARAAGQQVQSAHAHTGRAVVVTRTRSSA